MGYTYNCDGCETRFDRFPPFSGEFTETFIETSPSPLTAAFRPGQKVTLCRECSEAIFQPGKILSCGACGWNQHLSTLPHAPESCPRCDENDLAAYGEAHDERE